MKKFLSIISKIVNFILTILIILMVILVVFVFVSRGNGSGTEKDILGFNAYIVLSNSMSPTFDAGAMVFAKKATANEIKPNDIVTFYSKNGVDLVTHRFLRFETQEDGVEYIITKGDNPANDTDPPLEKERLSGKVLFYIPYLGNLISEMQNGYFMAIAIILLIVLLLMPVILDDEV